MQFEKMGKPTGEKPPRKPSPPGTPPPPKAPAQPSRHKAAGTAVKKRPFAFFYLPDGGLDKKMVALFSALIGGIVILVVLISLALLLPGCQQTPAASSQSSSKAPVIVGDASYDKTQNSLPQAEYAGTILPQSEDAGDAYVDETLFLGDSNTVRLVEFGADTGITLQNGIGVVGEAIQGAVQNNNIIFQGYNNVTMAKSVALVQPRRVVITFGTNNVGYTPVDDFIEYYQSFIGQIRQEYPSADIIIAAVPPIAQQHQSPQLSQSEVDKYNRALVELAQEEDCRFLNWSEALKDESTGYAKEGMMEKDGIHITRQAAQNLMEYFRTHSYITEDTRPKPLKAVPVHVQTPAPVVSSSSSSGKAPAATTGSSSLSSSVAPSSSSSSSSPPAPTPPVSTPTPPEITPPSPTPPAPTPPAPPNPTPPEVTPPAPDVPVPPPPTGPELTAPDPTLPSAGDTSPVPA